MLALQLTFSIHPGTLPTFPFPFFSYPPPPDWLFTKGSTEKQMHVRPEAVASSLAEPRCLLFFPKISSHLHLHSSIMGFSFIRGSSQPGAVSLQSCFRSEHPRLESFADDHRVVAKLGRKPWPTGLLGLCSLLSGKREYGEQRVGPPQGIPKVQLPLWGGRGGSATLDAVKFFTRDRNQCCERCTLLWGLCAQARGPERNPPPPLPLP